jgi:hypothetical protein
METYVNKIANVDLEIPVTAISGTFNVTAYEGSTLVYTFPTVSVIDTGYRVALPFSLVDKQRTLTINWSFNYLQSAATKTYASETTVEVISPIVPLSKLASILDGVSTEEQYEAELIVRKVIENYTHQTFGLVTEAKKVTGNNASQLALPMPLLELDSMTDDNFTYDVAGFVIRGEGWFLGQLPGGWYTIKDAPPEEVLDLFEFNTIVAPGAIKKRDFCFTSVYEITGTWGYWAIPAGVTEAAILLLNDYACQDSSYRDRYLHSINSADWRLQFTQGAFDGTGNIKADQLLNPYRLDDLVVI